MKYKTVYLLLFLLLCYGCNNVSTDTQIGEDLRFFKWLKFNIVNNTDQSADIHLSGITMTFDLSNDTRQIDEIISLSGNIEVVKTDNQQRFEQVFNQSAEDGELYSAASDNGNPLDKLGYDLIPAVMSTVAAHSEQTYYCQFECNYNRWTQSAIESVRMDLTVGSHRLSLFGWEQSEYEIDVSDDVQTLYDLEIWNNTRNPKNGYSGKSEDDLSESIRCYYFEETITINGDTTADIVVTKNYINPWNE